MARASKDLGFTVPPVMVEEFEIEGFQTGIEWGKKRGMSLIS